MILIRLRALQPSGSRLGKVKLPETITLGFNLALKFKR